MTNAFRDAAIADGWGPHPKWPEDAYWLEKSGFTMGGAGSGGQIYIWGPDGLHIAVPEAYSFDAIKAGLRRCYYCGATDVDTVRVGFAGRACKACQPKEEAKLGPRYYD